MDEVRIRLFGGVVVLRGAEVREHRSRSLQALLALLALQPGTAVDGGSIVDEMWPDGDLPQHPLATVHTRMSRLRAWLGGPSDLVTAHGGAYRLNVGPGQVDLACFLTASEQALAATEPQTVVTAADASLAPWSGDPLPDLDGPRIARARTAALRRRDRVLECRVRALLALGRDAEAVDTLLPLIEQRPDRESLHALLVEALHRSGRPREAAEAYLAARRHLRDEVGVAPGAELRAVYARVLEERTGPVPGRRGPRPVVVGRAEVLARIVAALPASAEGGRILVVEGEAGQGKSVLLAAARAGAEDAGATTLAGAWDESGTPMSAWFEALGPPPESFRSASAPWVRDRLERLAADAPLLVTLDDAHRADSASLGVLDALARAGPPAGVVVLVGARVPDVAPRLEWAGARAGLVAAGAADVLPLDGLDADAVTALARVRLQGFPAAAVDRLAGLVRSRVGGHPLHVAAVLDVLAARPDEQSAVAAVGRVPERLRPLLEHQVARLPPRTRPALEALAVLRPIDLPALADVLGRPGLDVAADLRPAVDAGLAVARPGGFALRHELTAEAVHDAVPHATRVELHRTRLVRLDAAPADADPFARLRHTLGAATVLPPADVGRARRGAAVAAYRRRALLEALRLLDDAVPDLGPDPVAAAYRGLVLGALGRHEESDDALDAALDDLLTPPHGSPGPVDASGPVDPSRADDDLVVAVAVGDEPLGTSVSGDARRLHRLHRVERLPLAPALRFELLASLVREESLAGRARPDLVAEMRRLATATGAPASTGARVRALEARQLVDAAVPALDRLATAADAFALAQDTGDALLALDATELLMTAALAAGRVERALELRALLAREAVRWHRPRLIWAGYLVLSALRLALGDHEGADAAAQEALARGQELGVADAPQAFAIHLMISNWLRGTAQALAAAAAGTADAHPAIPAWTAAAAVTAARAGDPDAARRRLGEFRARRAAITGRSFDRPALALAACAAFAAGDVDTARLVRAELPADPHAVVLVGFGAVICGPATLFTGVAAWTLGDHAGARADLAAAGELAAGLGWVPWADAADRLRASLDGDADVELPLGLGRRSGSGSTVEAVDR